MKVRVGIVLLVALVIEAVNFFYLAPPLDVGYEPGTPWYIQFIGLQWVLLHWLGVVTFDMVERVAGCHEGNVVAGCGRVDTVLFFVSGYLTTAVLLLAVTSVGMRFLSRRKPSASN